MPELSSVFSLVNYAFVLFFGIVAAPYLADIGFCDHKRVYVLTLFFFGIAQLLFLSDHGGVGALQMLSVSDPYPFDCLNFPAVSPESVNLCHLRFVCISAVHATQMVWHLCCFLF